MSVFGKVWGTSGTPPIPYDVRVGVDNGNGQLGTLTSPAVGSVIAGVKYGGDGTQYTGTFSIPVFIVSPPIQPAPSTWTDDSGSLFLDLWREFGAFLMYFPGGAYPIRCVKTPLDMSYEIEVSGATKLADTQIDVLRSEAKTSGFYNDLEQNPRNKRPLVTVEGQTFQVLQFQDDAADDAIKLICSRQQ